MAGWTWWAEWHNSAPITYDLTQKKQSEEFLAPCQKQQFRKPTENEDAVTRKKVLQLPQNMCGELGLVVGGRQREKEKNMLGSYSSSVVFQSCKHITWVDEVHDE